MKTFSLFISINLIATLFIAQNIPYFKVCLDYGIMDNNVKEDSLKTEFFERTDFGSYSFKYTYFINSINRVEITNLLGKVTVYEHFENNFLKSKGELIEDSSNFETKPIYFDGEGPVRYDTVFSLIPNGYWEIYNKNGIKETGYYLNGKKNGKWYTYINHSPYSKADSYLSEKKYKNDSLIHLKNNNAIFDNDYKNMLMKKWFYYYIPYKVNDSIELIYLSNKQFDNNRRNRNYRAFMKNEVYEDHIHFSCGVGLTEERVHPKGKWFLGEDNKLIIDGEEVTIMLLTEKYLILSCKMKK